MDTQDAETSGDGHSRSSSEEVSRIPVTFNGAPTSLELWSVRGEDITRRSRHDHSGGDDLAERPPPGPAQDPPIVRTNTADFGLGDNSNEAEINDADHRYTPPYGYRGQVVPGPLKMELVFCDGDLYMGPDGIDQSHWAGVVLQNDDGVYYSGRSKCNFILRHQGETCFDVKRIAIKASSHGSTAPIQEGMIFFCMENNLLIPRTASYAIQVSPPSSPSSSSGDYSVNFGGSRGSHVGRPQSRRSDPASARVIPPPISSSTNVLARPLLVHRTLRPRGGTRPSLHPSPRPSNAVEASTTLSGPSEYSLFQVTTDYDDHPSDDEEEAATAIVQDATGRDRPELRIFIDNTADRRSLAQSVIDQIHNYRVRMDAQQARLNEQRARIAELLASYDTPQQVIPGTSQDSALGDGISRVGSSDDGKDVKEPLKPHASFRIVRGKPKVNISFEPAV
ncbi:MAG: hypothetical protein Q9167_004956 [Letrouitia subvulpina]